MVKVQKSSNSEMFTAFRYLAKDVQTGALAFLHRRLAESLFKSLLSKVCLKTWSLQENVIHRPNTEIIFFIIKV
jgi:hypothetical protein